MGLEERGRYPSIHCSYSDEVARHLRRRRTGNCAERPHLDVTRVVSCLILLLDNLKELSLKSKEREMSLEYVARLLKLAHVIGSDSQTL